MLLEELIIKLGSVKSTPNKGTEFKIENGILYILGTDDDRDWIINFRAFRWGFHEGFLEEAQLLRYKLEYDYNDPEIRMIVGHSAGAAIGGFLGYMLDVPVIALGCPRYFNRNFLPQVAEYSDKKVVYFDLNNDYITAIPPWYSRGEVSVRAGSSVGFSHYLLDYQKHHGKFDLGKLAKYSI